jgi:hypothetical protein
VISQLSDDEKRGGRRANLVRVVAGFRLPAQAISPKVTDDFAVKFLCSRPPKVCGSHCFLSGTL